MHICIFINKLNVYFVHVIEFGGIIMIKKVVLTGGPCAGKSTAIAKISKVFTGFKWLGEREKENFRRWENGEYYLLFSSRVGIYNELDWARLYFLEGGKRRTN